MTQYRLVFLPKAEKQLAAIRDKRLRIPLERAIQAWQHNRARQAV